ncbi:MAG: ABC-2 family transporter protein [Proteobacteria bacterium]|nr:ABC-2 family transporter protein [Pseudomonadota bacterium]
MDSTRSPEGARGGFAENVALYGRYISISIMSQMQYKLSFLLAVVSQLLVTSLGVLGIWVMFSRFGSLGGWGLHEVLVFYGLVNVAFAIADALATGFDRFGSEYIRQGGFDRLLLRPRSVSLQLLGHELALRRLGGFTQGLIVLTWGLGHLDVPFDPATLLFTLYIIGCAVCLFLAIFILQATLSFWTVESIELMNTMTYGGVEASQYPMSIYEPWFRHFFTFVVPLACVTYFPVLVLLGRDDPVGTSRWFQMLCPLAGPIFLMVSIQVFERLGVRYYTSTGS